MNNEQKEHAEKVMDLVLAQLQRVANEPQDEENPFIVEVRGESYNDIIVTTSKARFVISIS